MADKQYYVKVNFEWGTDVDGVLASKNTGGVAWVSMPYDNSVGLQAYAIIPAINDMLVKAGELGLMTTSLDLPEVAALKEKGAKLK